MLILAPFSSDSMGAPIPIWMVLETVLQNLGSRRCHGYSWGLNLSGFLLLATVSFLFCASLRRLPHDLAFPFFCWAQQTALMQMIRI